ncbi:MAG: response regulator transcription factor [Caldimicrobium sp.]|nr:response regulator transcription factor [Caldimicrobium sp.]MCX7613935.1 response regulator transcription factor [Caldimicrobium sp.]MDW8182018.1 response regulator transcription factor [Caldimicrobium sp.]
MAKRILVVDDDPDILTVVSSFLKIEGFHVLEAQDVKSAQEIFQRENPELIILDIMLPDQSGLEWLKDLKAKYPAIPIILLTAKSSLSDKVLGFELGADDYLSKPFEPLELVARCKALLRKAKLVETPKKDFLLLGDLKIDIKGRRIFKSDREVHLTPKEWKILSLLLSEPGKAFSREEIKNAIWVEKKIYNWSRVLDVHIKNLREKIEDDPNNPKYVVTVHGFGYKIQTTS